MEEESHSFGGGDVPYQLSVHRAEQDPSSLHCIIVTTRDMHHVYCILGASSVCLLPQERTLEVTHKSESPAVTSLCLI